MPNATAIAFIVIYAVEAVVVIMGNAFTIFVFWTQRFHLTRTCFLLIKLAVADFLVGVTEPIVLRTEKIRKMTAVRGQIIALKVLHQHFKSLVRVRLCSFSP